jgi:3'(2'), 5'-bisphosphate nucleotidase
MEVAVRVVQVACTLCQRVQDTLLRPGADAGGRVHSKLDRSPVTVAGSYCWLLIHRFPFSRAFVGFQVLTPLPHSHD